MVPLSPENQDGNLSTINKQTYANMPEKLNKHVLNKNAYSCRPCNVIIARAADARSW